MFDNKYISLYLLPRLNRLIIKREQFYVMKAAVYVYDSYDCDEKLNRIQLIQCIILYLQHW